jgi:hypothetical protein
MTLSLHELRRLTTPRRASACRLYAIHKSFRVVGQQLRPRVSHVAARKLVHEGSVDLTMRLGRDVNVMLAFNPSAN